MDSEYAVKMQKGNTYNKIPLKSNSHIVEIGQQNKFRGGG
jgi:DNA-binding CsgD family transcriptional regulator